MSEVNVQSGCSQQFAELCALATSGNLTPEEWQTLEEHVSVCPQCEALLADYKALASTGLAKVAAARSAKASCAQQETQWDRTQAKMRFLNALEGANAPQPVSESRTAAKSAKSWIDRFVPQFDLRATLRPLGVAAVVVLAALTAFYVGVKKGTERGARAGSGIAASPSTVVQADLRPEFQQLEAEKKSLDLKLAADAIRINRLEQRATQAERDLAQMQSAKSSIEAKSQEQSSSLATLSGERDTLEKRLHEAEATLQSVRQELDSTHDDRQRLLLRSASLETQVDRLTAELREHEDASERTQQYLASDRDVRELMGARQLYIADVFDIDSQGKTKTPFGRVFYTKGKSLIFYAFDLDKQPGYREAKAFQAWGRPSPSQSAPVSLGIFYMDNEANRRWALKFDDPKILDEISSVFVTVEPKGGSKKPTNKPFLLAYLHTAPPNHP
ncbi:MAG: anti-sigma factor [Acidobacteriia bacterium]|nr:anti-sigma factor [Terriglobia bacterium]